MLGVVALIVSIEGYGNIGTAAVGQYGAVREHPGEENDEYD